MVDQILDWRHHSTDRLVLDHLVEADVDELYALHADPRVWEHFPTGRHRSPVSTQEMISETIEQWKTYGLGYWAVREAEGGPIIGCGGCRPCSDPHGWNLYYRFAPDHQGKGYATELARSAVEAAASVDAQRVVIAIMLAHNPGSIRVAERVGLTRIWEGPDEGNPDPSAIRYVYADRPDVELSSGTNG